MPHEADGPNATQSSYGLRPRARATKSAGADEDYDPRTETAGNERDDAGDAYTPASVESTIVESKKRKRAGRGEKASKRPKTQASTQALAASPAIISLEGMLNLPLDVILVVLSHSTPFDLLNLARTKPFRPLLMSRSSKRTWLNAWKNDDVPPCPDDMTPPACAELLYDDWCHWCFTTKGEMQWYWNLEARYCTRCVEHMNDQGYYHWDDIQYGFSPPGSLARYIPCLDHASTFRLMDISEFVQAWKQVPIAQRDKFLYTRKQAVDRRDRFAELCEKWKYRSDCRKRTARRLARLGQVASIIDRLKEMGWNKVFEDMTVKQQNAFLALPDVRKDRKLTDRVIGNMLPRLIPWLQACKEEQEFPLRVKKIKKQFKELDNALLPVPSDHNTLPSLRDIILEMPEAREAIDVALDATGSFDTILASLPTFVKEWRRRNYAKLEDRVRQSLWPKTNIGQPLALAVGSYFECICHSHVSLPDCLNHRCLGQTGAFERNDHYYWSVEEDREVYTAVAAKFLANIPTLKDRRWGSHARALYKIVSKCEYDPETATPEEMDASDVRLVCLKHSTPRKKEILTWRAAIIHECSSLLGEYKKATKEDALAVKPQEEAKIESYVTRRPIHCAHCPRNKRYTDYTIEKLFQHLIDRHGIEAPNEQDGFYETTLPPICIDPVYLSLKIQRSALTEHS